MSIYETQQARKRAEVFYGPWDSAVVRAHEEGTPGYRRALIESGMVREARERRLESLGIPADWSDEEIAAALEGMQNSKPEDRFILESTATSPTAEPFSFLPEAVRVFLPWYRPEVPH